MVHYVYIIKSIKHSDRIYIGITRNVKYRIVDHNRGKSKYTSKFKPWTLKGAVVFTCKKKAFEFEKYLKTASGKAFMRKRLINI